MVPNASNQADYFLNLSNSAPYPEIFLTAPDTQIWITDSDRIQEVK
jgi:hypothetical protein